MDNIVHIPFKREYLTELATRIIDTVYEYADRISLAEAVGVLEIVKSQVLEEQTK